jgi:TIR domain-containing protein
VTSDSNAEHGAQERANIFVSYSRKDTPFIDRLEAALIARGFAPKIDRSDVFAFEDWWKRIEELIAKADTIVFVLSPDAVRSDVCQKELEFAASLRKRIAPIVCREVDTASIPYKLTRLNFILFDDDTRFDEQADRLAEALSTDIDWIRKHTEFGELARRWAESDRPSHKGLLLRPPSLEEAEKWIASRPQSAPEPTKATRDFVTESRRAETKRRKVLTASLGTGLFIALTLTAFAVWQWRVANTEREKAERNFSVAQRAVENIVGDLARRAGHGRTPVQFMGELIGQTEKSLDEIEASVPDEPQFTYLRASAAVEISKALRTAKAPGAKRAAEDAVKRFERLAALAPKNESYSAGLVRARTALAEIQLAESKASDGFEEFEKAISIAEAIANNNRDSQENRKRLAEAHEKYGEELDRIGVMTNNKTHSERAAAQFRKALEIRKPIVASDYDQMDIANNYGSLARAILHTGDYLAALSERANELKVREEIYASRSYDQRQAEAIADLYRVIADIKQSHDDLNGAIGEYEREANVRKGLADADGTNVQRKLQIVNLHIDIADLKGKINKIDEAFEEYLFALYELQTIDQLIIRHSEVDATKNNISDRLGNIALQSILDRYFSRSIKVSDAAIRATPEKKWLYANRAHALMFLGRAQEARNIYLKFMGEKVLDEKTWNEIVIDNFQQFSQRGLANPLMPELIERLSGN